MYKNGTYSWFQIKGVYTHSMETIYLSQVHIGSRGNLFHETSDTKNSQKNLTTIKACDRPRRPPTVRV